MSAERLRAAATLLRERADAATPGPWIAPGPLGVRGNGDRNWVADTTVSQAPMPDAMLIEVMNPTVALAVADWLDHEADRIDLRDSDPEACRHLLGFVTPGEIRRSSAVADAILAGGAS